MKTIAVRQSSSGQIRTPAPLKILLRLSDSTTARSMAEKKNVPRCDGGAREKFGRILTSAWLGSQGRLPKRPWFQPSPPPPQNPKNLRRQIRQLRRGRLY